MTTAATARGRSGWMRTMVLTLGVALLGLTPTPPAAQAADSDPSANATFQILLCEAGGGTATVDATRTPGAGLAGVQVTCTGGVFDGMDCFNSSYGTTCTGAHPRPVPREAGSHVWQLDSVIPVLESGSVAQMHDILADVEAANAPGPAAAPSVVSLDDQDQDRDHNTNKSKGKKGKKRGKGRKN